MVIGDRIRRIRKKRRLTQAELAMMSGLSLSAIQGYEQGRYEPKRKSLKSIAEVFKIPVDELYDMPAQLSTNLAEVGTDAISRADAIKIVQNRCKRYTTACVLAVTEIKQLPPIQPVNCSEFPNNSDTVSRQKAKNAICNACGKIDCDEMDTCEKLNIPSEGSKALEWQYHSYIPHNKYCPKCKKDSPYNKRWNFCPNCGVDMRGEQE